MPNTDQMRWLEAIDWSHLVIWLFLLQRILLPSLTLLFDATKTQTRTENVFVFSCRMLQFHQIHIETEREWESERERNSEHKLKLRLNLVSHCARALGVSESERFFSLGSSFSAAEQLIEPFRHKIEYLVESIANQLNWTKLETKTIEVNRHGEREN